MKLFSFAFGTLIILFAVTGLASAKGKIIHTNTNAAPGIRQVDFKNLDYGRNCAGHHKFLPVDQGDRLVLRNGHVQFEGGDYADLGSVEYVDFNGDGKEEAFVVVKGQTTGSSNAYLAAYVFAYRNGKPRQLWTRCEESSAAELKGRSILFTRPEWVGADAHCCFSLITTETYRWKGSRFALISSKRRKSRSQ